jgi:hypothetical protein
MGENAEEIINHDRSIRANSWRRFSADWMQHGHKALEVQNYINANALGDVNMCVAGTFDGGTYLPFAIISQMFRKSEKDYFNLLRKVSKRTNITVD